MTYETQPEALRLADECEESAKLWAHEIDTRKRAAAELRRLHVQAAQDEALMRQALEALDSGHPDIQLRTAIALRKRLEEQSWPPNRERLAETANDLARCPNCGGPADNGHDREVPPNPYWCSKCTES